MQIGIVGLPNVGKSTLFNAITKTQGAEAANYPFCTIDPNVGIVEIQDERLKNLETAVGAQKVIPAVVEFVDIAGLVKGASQGEGLGNQFLSHIRSCNAIAQVVRYFEDGNITHVHETVDPARDIEIIHTELILADMQTLGKRYNDIEKKANSGDKEMKVLYGPLKKVKEHMDQGKLAYTCDLSPEERLALREFHLLTMKPIMYVVNMSEEQLASVNVDEVKAKLGIEEGLPVLKVCAKLEEELAALDDEEREMYLQEVGISDTGIDSMIKTAYDTLGLQYYFTAGEKEVRAWTVKKGASAPQAAGVIHTDFEKGFIKADVVKWNDLVEAGGWSKAREAGKVRMEGKDYTVQDGDVILFKFNV